MSQGKTSVSDNAHPSSASTEIKEDHDNRSGPYADCERGPGRKCDNCYVVGSTEVVLKMCSRCRAVLYCSSECQAAHWKKHKKVCFVGVAQAASLLIQDLVKGPTSSGISRVELDFRLEKWIKFHSINLMLATIHALDLQCFFERSRTHMLRITISLNPVHSQRVGKYFKLDSAEVISYEDARKRDHAWAIIVKQMQDLREDNERQDRGTTISMGIECAPLAVQVVPFGSVTKARVQGLGKRVEETLCGCFPGLVISVLRGDLSFDDF